MDFQPVTKHPEAWAVQPNLLDYERTRAEFSWAEVEEALDFLPDDRGVNIAYEAVDRHAKGPLRDKLALRWLGKKGAVRAFTYGDLMIESNRFANVLADLGIGKGDRVFVLSSRIPELYISVLGTLKNASVLCPLFSAFGPEPIWQRIHKGDGKVLVTTRALYKRKIAKIRTTLPQLEYILLADSDIDLADDIRSLPRLMAAASAEFEIPPTDPEDMALLHFTSGTTGMPKGAVHVHNAVIHHYVSGMYALDLQLNDVYWCTADPGWVTGISYGIVSPLCHGVTMIVDEAEFDAERWYHILEEQQVSIWYTAPTAVRRLMRLESDPLTAYDLSHLRFIASVGEPLNPEAVAWSMKTLEMPIHDNWWQTETGGIMIANFAGMDIRPGSMGKPLPGVEAAILEKLDDGTVKRITAPFVEGHLALKPGWPSMFRGYLHDEDCHAKCFVDGW